MLETSLNILIVEDNNSKYKDIKDRLTEFNAENDFINIKFQRAKGAFSAVRAYGNGYFDVVILDLHIPQNDHEDDVIDEDNCSVENAAQVYKYVRDKVVDSPFLVIGLTALKQIDYQTAFEKHPILRIEDYNSPDWFDNIISQFKFIVNGKRALRNFVNNNYEYDVILLVARKSNEYYPIRESIDWLNRYRKHPRLDHLRESAFGEIQLPNGKMLKLGIVCLGEMGLSIAGAYTAQLIHYFRPRYFGMLGMCCGFKESKMYKRTKLGDVIIARQTANWDEGKYTDEEIEEIEDPYFHHRAVEKMTDVCAELIQILDSEKKHIESMLTSFYEEKENVKDIATLKKFDKKATVHFDTLLSGASVVNNAKVVKKIRGRFPHSMGLEMEAHAVYSAAESILGIKPKTLVIKGVADHGDGQKTKSIQGMCSIASWKVFLKLLSEMENNLVTVAKSNE